MAPAVSNRQPRQRTDHDRYAVAASERFRDKLRVARERAKTKNGHCEGRKPFGFYPGEAETLELMRKMRPHYTLQQIADELLRRGIRPRTGARWYPKTVARILTRVLV